MDKDKNIRMKNKTVSFRITILCLFLNAMVYSAPPPPPPPPAPTDGPPPPLGFPIDENIMVVVVLAVIFGLYIVYKHHLKQKTPI